MVWPQWVALFILCASLVPFCNGKSWKRKSLPVGAIRITEDIFCIPNPPTASAASVQGSLCHYTPALTQWLYETAFQKLELDEEKEPKQKRVKRRMEQSPCIGRGGDFPPLKRQAGYKYNVCTFWMQKIREEGDPFNVFLPSDDQDKIAECDILPWLIRFATNGTAGLAIDIGAGDSGSCSWPLLSEGHEVHMFEPGYGYEAERSFVELTRDINGWQKKATLHGAVNADSNLKDLFESTSKIDLLKIDVDDRESYEAVFAGVIPVLHKVEILQIEMLEEEIGWNGVMWIADTFLSQDFMMFGLEDVETFPGFQHDSLGRACQEDDIPSTMHVDEVTDGEIPYEYGKDGPGKVRMFPICRCESSVELLGRGRASKDPLACNAQFAFVKRNSAALKAVTQQFGSCEATCMTKSEL